MKKQKIRNHLAKEVRNPNGPYRPSVVRDKTKYRRKDKHKGSRNDSPFSLISQRII